jgi:hypothetical protein
VGPLSAGWESCALAQKEKRGDMAPQRAKDDESGAFSGPGERFPYSRCSADGSADGHPGVPYLASETTRCLIAPRLEKGNEVSYVQRPIRRKFVGECKQIFSSCQDVKKIFHTLLINRLVVVIVSRPKKAGPRSQHVNNRWMLKQSILESGRWF